MTVARTRDLRWSAVRHVGRRTANALLEAILPVACVVCGAHVVQPGGRPNAPTRLVCGRCWAALPVLHHPRCDRCDHPRRFRPTAASGDVACAWCALLPPYVRACRSVCWVPDGVGGAVVRALKYEGWTRVADEIGARVAALPWPDDVAAERTAAVPVPLAPTRLRERGYNQSALIAAAVARAWGVPVWPGALDRTRATPSQTRLTPGERLTNVAGAFRAADAFRAQLRGAHVVLIDDVVTTAATLNACAAALVAGGARIVSYTTFGRARS